MQNCAPTTPHLLTLSDVYQKYGDKVILDDIDLSVSSGEFLTVVGPSGCGKSTMLRIIIGQEQPHSGRALLDGNPIKYPTRSGGVVYQNYSLYPNLTVLENALLGYRLQTSPIAWWRHRKEVLPEAEAALEEARLIEHKDKYPFQLSGGQQQRAAIMQALLQDPKVLCLDEPFSALDAGTRERMQMYLLELQQKKLQQKKTMTFLFVTHDLEEALYLGTRCVALTPFYTDDRGDDPTVNRGATIVVDCKLREIGEIRSPEVKKTAAFGELLQQVRRDAFDEKYRKSVDKFTLTHPDSWRSFDPQYRKLATS